MDIIFYNKAIMIDFHCTPVNPHSQTVVTKEFVIVIFYMVEGNMEEMELSLEKCYTILGRWAGSPRVNTILPAQFTWNWIKMQLTFRWIFLQLLLLSFERNCMPRHQESCSLKLRPEKATAPWWCQAVQT